MVKKENRSKHIAVANIIAKLIVIGIFTLVACILIGIVLVQLICWLVDYMLEGLQNKNWCIGMENYVSDFLGGAIGLTIGLLLDKICIDKINCVYQYQSFMRIIKHEMNNIKEIIADNCEAINKKNEYISSIKEFIVDDVVTSAETISIISNIPYSKEALNTLVDKIGEIHRGVTIYNELLEHIKTEAELLKKADILNREKTLISNATDKLCNGNIDVTSKDHYFGLINELNKNSKELSDKIDELLNYTK